MIKKLFLIVFLGCTAFYSKAQEQQEPTELKYNTVYSFVPQYIAIHGLRIDIDKHLSGRNWLQFAPVVYLHAPKDNIDFELSDSYSSMAGLGLAVYHRVYAQADVMKNGLYFSYGPMYNYINMEYKLEENNEVKTYKGDINMIGGDFLLGYQFYIRKIVTIDLYTGLAARHSMFSTNGPSTKRYSDSGPIGYNYSGNTMILGFRLGVAL